MPVRDNRYILEEDRDFFILLRAGLWQKAEEPLSDAPDWEYIYTIACEQTVQGIVADGITIVKAAYGQGQFDTPFPTGEHWQETYDKFLSAVAQIVRRNHQINQKQAEINSLFDEQSIRYYVVKGQEAAKNYPKPMLRCSGDIDYLMPLDHLRLAQNLLTPLATSIEPYEEYLQHQGFMLGDIEVELHGALHPRLGKRIDKVLDRLQEELFDGTVSYDTFNAVYVLLHCLQHFHWSGLGIRQILDWTMLLATSRDIDPARVQKSISDMHIKQEWSNFLCFCVKWLGMDTSMMYGSIPGSKHIRLTSYIWNNVTEMGNMGHKRKNVDLSQMNYLFRHFFQWNNFIYDYLAHHRVTPYISKHMLHRELKLYFTILTGGDIKNE